MIVPAAMQALHALKTAVTASSVPPSTITLIELRASQVNGDSVCVDSHPRLMRKAGETDDRIFAVAAWRRSPYFSEAERAALALTEAVTRLGEQDNPVPDEVWAEAALHFDEPALAALLIAIANINVWNRLNISTGQVAGQWKP